MKKCKGCGVKLQDQFIDQLGYVKDMNQDYCKRCFRLIHYGDNSKLHTDSINNEKIIDIYRKYSNDVFVLIIDIFDLFVLDIDDYLELFKDYRKIVIINKIDLLPLNISEYKLNKTIERLLYRLNKKYPNIDQFILTHKKDSYFNDLFINTISEYKDKRFIFAGRTNAGKSTIINKLLNKNELTVSSYPSTTLDEVEIDYDRYKFIDTPGIIDYDNYSAHISETVYNRLLIKKTIKPIVFQIKDAQSFIYDGILRIDINKPKDKTNITFYLNNDIEIHRLKTINADDYIDRHCKEFIIDKPKYISSKYHNVDKNTYLIKGIGMFKIIGDVDIKIYLSKDVPIYLLKESI